MGLFVIVWDFSGYLSGLSGYPLGHDIIDSDAALPSGITEGMSCESMKLFLYRVG